MAFVRACWRRRVHSSHPFECQVEHGETLFGVNARQAVSPNDAVDPLPLPGVDPGIWPMPPFLPTPFEPSKTIPKTIDDKDDKDKDKSGEGSGLSWVLVLLCLVLLSGGAGAFFIRRSRRVAQLADGTY